MTWRARSAPPATRAPSASDRAITLPVDVGAVLLDGRLHWFVAHLVARRRLWHGPFAVAMNAEWCGDLSLGPARPSRRRAAGRHDRRRSSWGDRLKARRRARTGDHLPHPDLRTERTAARAARVRPTVDIWLDGQRVGLRPPLSIRVEPAALSAVV